jgi:flagellar biosynthesis/type III secretory pathway chaperone
MKSISGKEFAKLLEKKSRLIETLDENCSYRRKRIISKPSNNLLQRAPTSGVAELGR